MARLSSHEGLVKEKQMTARKNRTKYHLKRKDRTPEQYQSIKLVIDGQEVEISNSSKFLLEMLIKEDDEKQGE